MAMHALDISVSGGSSEAANALGALGAELNLLILEFGAPVPPGFALDAESTAALAADGWTDDLVARFDEALAALEGTTGRIFDDAAAPLLVTVRPGFAGQLPGEVDTLLDIGVACGIDATGHHADLDATRSFLENYGRIVDDIDAARFHETIAAATTLAGTEDLPAELLAMVCDRHRDLLTSSGGLPDTSRGQLMEALASCARRWTSSETASFRRRSIGDTTAPTIVVQAMAHNTNTGRLSHAIVSSRDLTSGDPQSDLHRLADHPDLAEPVAELLGRVEAHHRDAVMLDLVVGRNGDAPAFAVVGGRVGRRSGTAAVRIATQLADAGVLTRDEAVSRVSADHVEQILHPSFDASLDAEPVTMGLGASPGAASGVVAFSADDAAVRAANGQTVILVAQETSPEDMHGMEQSAGILTTRGGLASHAAVVARGWGTPAVCGAEQIQIGDDMMTIGSTVIKAGDEISIDGGTGNVYLGSLGTVSAEPPSEFETMLAWADDIRGDRLAVRANADTGADAEVARSFGAQGIGLCRTEHMFLAEDRLPMIRQMILAATPAKEKMALTRLRLAQRDDFVSILEAMDGLPVTVRLLDPPLHEFLPDLEELIVAEARGELDDKGRELLRAAREWSEVNPMIGTRGVRLGWLKPGLYEMQVTALVEAVAERVAAGGDPVIEIMIPLTISAPELEGARRWVTDALDAAGVETDRITIGTMVETPRAALVADELADHADFFSFGTNDLSQLTFGFSRDDVESRIMGLYLDEALLDANPFERLDRTGVGQLVRMAVQQARGVKPDLKLGVCGEHGGDPSSIEFFLDVGLDYVSCSPYRVPVARLAAAQAVLAGG